MKKKKAKKQQYYKGFPIDSEGEMNFIMWMEELKEEGYIEKYERGQSYLLSDSLVNNYVETLKTKSKPKTQTILHGHSYTPDFFIMWTTKGFNIFCNNLGEKWVKPFMCDGKFSYIEAKPPFDFANMSRLAMLNIKWMWQKYKIHVQMVKNIELFEKTFTPKAYLVTKTGKTRLVKHKFRTLKEYINGTGK